MAKLSGLSQYFDPGLTLGGVPGADGAEREYVIPLPSAELGLWCEQTAQAVGRIQAADTEAEIKAAIERVNALPELDSALSLGQKVLGSAYADMMADGVAHPYIQRCAGTAYAWIVGGEDAAERYWKSGGRPNPEGPVPNRADKRAAAKSAGTNGGAAGKTRTPASTSGTRSPRKSAPKKASRSPGKRSSSAGT